LTILPMRISPIKRGDSSPLSGEILMWNPHFLTGWFKRFWASHPWVIGWSGPDFCKGPCVPEVCRMWIASAF
jgi:hypothetical protein